MKQAYKFVVCGDNTTPPKARYMYVVSDYMPFTDSNGIDLIRLLICKCYATDFTSLVGSTMIDKFYARNLYRVKQSYK